MSYQQSSYRFLTIGAWRTFHHRWFTSGRTFECAKCNSTINKNEPHYRLWQNGATARDSLHINEEQRKQLDIIVAKGVESYFLCAAYSRNNTSNYILDAGMQIIPELLRILFLTAQQLKIMIGFCTRSCGADELVFQSSELPILHHYDVREGVEIILTMLWERIVAYTKKNRTKNFDIKSIRIDVKRIKGIANQMYLPLKYRLIYATPTAPRTADCSTSMQEITDAYRKYHGNLFATLGKFKKLNVNLYCLQMCRNTRELFVAPYFLSDEKNMNDSSVRSYIILDDIKGEFQQLVQINNLYPFLHIDVGDRVHSCSVCQRNFMESTTLALHRTLHCGREFQTIKVPSDIIEIYEHCIKLHWDNDRCTMWGVWNE